jgi:hypothetical protein
MRGGATDGGADGAIVGLSAEGADGITVGRGAGVTGGVATGATGLVAGGAATAMGFAATGGTAGRAGGATTSFCCVMARSTSPGREMFDKSILVLISSSPREGRADLAAVDAASDSPRRRTRTFSASWSSSELEWVFFSVTPTTSRTSRIALLLTSSSLARSLIRTLLIRPFVYPALWPRSSLRPHGVVFLCSHVVATRLARAIAIRSFPEQSHLPAHARALRSQQILR